MKPRALGESVANLTHHSNLWRLGGFVLAPTARLHSEIDAFEPRRFEGRVTAISGAAIEVQAPRPALIMGAEAIVDAPSPVRAELVGFRAGAAVLMPLDPPLSIQLGARVTFVAPIAAVHPAHAWLGRVLDAYGAPLDGAGPLPKGSRAARIHTPPPLAHARARVGARMQTGVRALDVFCALCKGQRLGVFAGSGVGKSVLMSMLARGAAADVIVIGLIGERGREVKEFLEDTLDAEGRARSVVVVATSDEPAARRRRAALTTMAVAEHFRDEGKHVLLLLDSVTRFAMAGREIGLAAGEPPTTKGYTPSVFADLPRLMERAGPGIDGTGGAITAIFTVLVDGDDHNEPIADAARGILDGHVVMQRDIAARGRYPAINVLKSVSRLMPMCHAPHEADLVRQARALMAAYADMEELIRIGAYKQGANALLDRAIALRDPFEAFLNQNRDEATPLATSFARLSEILT
jgi:flagellum-specific ATP synthase